MSDYVKVAVWAGNERASLFYAACGFRLARVRRHHGLLINTYVLELFGDGTVKGGG